MADFRPSAGFDPAGFRPSAGSDPVAGSGLAAGSDPVAGSGLAAGSDPVADSGLAAGSDPVAGSDLAATLHQPAAVPSIPQVLPLPLSVCHNLLPEPCLHLKVSCTYFSHSRLLFRSLMLQAR